MKKKTQRSAKPTMTIEHAFGVMMQEMADIRLELKNDMKSMKTELKGDIAVVATDLKNLTKDVGGLRVQLHQNQLMFMNYMDRTDQRLDRVEANVS